MLLSDRNTIIYIYSDVQTKQISLLHQFYQKLQQAHPQFAAQKIKGHLVPEEMNVLKRIMCLKMWFDVPLVYSPLLVGQWRARDFPKL